MTKPFKFLLIIPAVFLFLSNQVGESPSNSSKLDPFQLINSENIAQNRPASQSSTEHDGVASRAVDGDTNGVWNNRSVTHTSTSENPWWQVDLGSSRQIKTVKIYNRTDGCCTHRLRNIFVVLSNRGSNPFMSAVSPSDAESKGLSVFRVAIAPDADRPSVLIVPSGNNARFVRVWMESERGILSLAEVQVFEDTEGTPTNDTQNLAFGKNTTQSSNAHGGVASRAVDGTTDGHWGNGSVTHTANSSNPWWQVDLGSSRQIRTVKIYNRTDCCWTRLGNIYVVLSNQNSNPFGSSTSPSDAQSKGFSIFRMNIESDKVIHSVLELPSGNTARFVRIWMEGGGVLSLAEVEIFENPDPTSDTGIIENLARTGTASQISTDFSGSASRAIDGNRNGAWGNGSVTHTTSVNNPWWQVDLGTSKPLGEISIYNRTDCCSDRLRHVFAVVSNSNNASNPFGSAQTPNQASAQGFTVVQFTVNLNASGPSVVHLPENTQGRFVRIWKSDNGILSLAEVEITSENTVQSGLPPLLNPPAGTQVSTISILIIYNNFVQFELDNYYEVRAEDWVNGVISDANNIYRRSGVWQSLEIAELHFEEMTEEENAHWLLSLLNQRDFGTTSNLFTNLRRRHNADVVIFWGKRGTAAPGARGIGVNAQHAFIHLPQGSMDDETLVHELGHLQGATHQEGSVHPIVPDHEGFATIMNSQDCAREASSLDLRKEGAPILSNPDVSYNGIPTGVEGIWNSAEILNQTRERFARFSEELDDLEETEGAAQLQIADITSVSIGGGNIRYAVNSENQLWKWEAYDWYPVTTPVRVQKVSVGNANQVWFIGTDGFLYQKSGNSWLRRDFRANQSVTELAVASDGTVFIVDSANSVWIRNNGTFERTRFRIPGGGGNMMARRLAMNSVSNAYAISMSGNLWKWNTSVRLWERKSNAGNLTEIAAGEAGNVWAINSNSKLFRSQNEGVDFSNFASWEDVKGVVAGPGEVLWKISTDNKIQKLVDFSDENTSTECDWRDVRWQSRWGLF